MGINDIVGECKKREDGVEVRISRVVIPTMEMVRFVGVLNGEEVWGGVAEAYRTKSCVYENEPFGEWKIHYTLSGGDSYEEKLPCVAAINAAMEFVRKQKEER